MHQQEAPAAPERGKLYRFVDCEIDTIRRELRRDGEPVEVQPKIFDLLVHLIEHRDRMVDKDELLDVIWAGTVVSESSLTQAIRRARSIVGDDGDRQDVIRTMHRRGYRFVAAIEEVAPEVAAEAAPAAELPPEAAPATRSRRLLFAIPVLLALLAAVWYFAPQPGDAPRDAPGDAVGMAAPDASIAVLPFEDMSANRDSEYFSDGLSEELLNVLAQVPNLQVAARTSSFAFKGTNTDIPTIGERLNVAYVLEGSVRKADDDIRITAQLIRVDTGYHLWSQTYDRKFDDIFLVQQEIAEAVADSLKLTLFGANPIKTTAIDPEAYTIFLRGRFFLRRSTPEDISRAIEHFQQATSIDPGFARAWHMLGSAYIRQANFGLVDHDEGYDRGRASILRALEEDPDLGAAHAQLGWLTLHHDWDMGSARQHIDRALALPPVSYESISYAGTVMLSLGQVDAAIALREQVVAMDPLGRGGFHNLGVAYMFAGDFDRAEAMLRRALAISPDYLSGNFFLGVVLLVGGDAEAALPVFARERDEAWNLEGRALAYHALGRDDESDQALERLKAEFADDMTFQIGEVHAYRGEFDEAFSWFDRAYDRHDGGLWDTRNNPLLAGLESDPRWQALLERLGIAPQ